MTTSCRIEQGSVGWVFMGAQGDDGKGLQSWHDSMSALVALEAIKMLLCIE
jgi:hypothetical protein